MALMLRIDDKLATTASSAGKILFGQSTNNELALRTLVGNGIYITDDGTNLTLDASTTLLSYLSKGGGSMSGPISGLSFNPSLPAGAGESSLSLYLDNLPNTSWNGSGELGTNFWITLGTSGETPTLAATSQSDVGPSLSLVWPANITLTADSGAANCGSNTAATFVQSVWAQGTCNARLEAFWTANMPATGLAWIVEEFLNGSWVPAKDLTMSDLTPQTFTAAGCYTMQFKCATASQVNYVRIRIYAPSGTVMPAGVPQLRFRAQINYGSTSLMYDPRQALMQLVTNSLTFGGTKTFSGSIVVGGGSVVLNNSSSNLLNFGTAGVAAPTFSSRSVGTKIVLYSSLGSSTTDYAIGMGSQAMWFSIPGASTSYLWYAGTTQIASMSGAGFLLVQGVRSQAAGVPGQFYVTGIANSSGPSMVEVSGSSSATPTVYTRLGGLYGDFTSGARSAFGLYSDTDLWLQAASSKKISFRVAGTEVAYMASNGAITTTGAGLVTIGGDSNGSIELGNSSGTGTAPYIDFHYGVGSAQDYNARLVNQANNKMQLLFAGGASAGIFDLGGALWINGTQILSYLRALQNITSADFTGQVNINQAENYASPNIALRIGQITNAGGTFTAGWGPLVQFSGGSAGPQWNSDQSDGLYMGRYNSAENASELRVCIGDDSQNQDRFAIGNGSPASWALRHYFASDGTWFHYGDGTATGTLTLLHSDASLILKAAASPANDNCYLAYYTNGGTRKGYVGYGASGNNGLYISSEAADGTVVLSTAGTARMTVAASGAITATSTITASDFILSSDRRLKEDLAAIESALDRVDSLHGYTFRYRQDADNRRRAGVVAQEVQAVLPEAVLDQGDYLGVSYDAFVPLFIEAIKELRREVETLRRHSTTEGRHAAGSHQSH